MRVKKKKGFTLIEVVAALAILTAGVVAIYGGFMNSTKIWNKEKVNLELVSGAQNISQVLKAEGKLNIGNICNNYDAKFYVYFNGYSDIYNSFQPSSSYSSLRHTSACNFQECSSLNPGSKYGALIQIENDALSTSIYSNYKYYKIDLKVWSISTGAVTESVFYIGGDDI